jgi:hypothetical protein
MFHNKACAKVMPPYMPVATHAVIRLPVGFIPGKLDVPGFGNSCSISTRLQRFAYSHLLDTHQTWYFHAFTPLAHYHAFWTQQQWAV